VGLFKISLRYSQFQHESIGVKRRGSHLVYLIYMDYIFIISRLTLFSLSHKSTVAFNAAKNNNNNNKEIVRASRPMSYISPRYYSSSVSRTHNNNVLPSSVNKFSTISDPLVEESLHGWFITGFTDGEGCFRISLLKDPRNRLGWNTQAFFSIWLHLKDLDLLKQIQVYFGGIGAVRSSKDKCSYVVSSLSQISNIIIPHFDKYPLISQKQGDYLLFKDVVLRMLNKEHLTREGLKQIVAIKASLNLGLPKNLKQTFPSVIPIQRPTIFKPLIPHAKWMQGFTTGEGCFYVNIFKSSHHKLGFQVRVEFELAQHIRDTILIESVKDYLSCGIVSSYSKGMVKFKCIRFTDIYSIVIPFFKEHYPLGNKGLDFLDFCKVVKLMEDKAHLSGEGLEEILRVKAGMNTKRVY